jgi:hypothetical protein
MRRENNYSQRDRREQQDRQSTRDLQHQEKRQKLADEYYNKKEEQEDEVLQHMTPTNLPTGDEAETRMLGDSKMKVC